MANSNKQKKTWRDWLFNDNAVSTLTPEESLELRDAIIAEPRVANRFFTHTLKPLWANMSAYLSQNTAAEFSNKDIMTCVYRETYDFGKWSRLQAYNGNTSIFSWISMIARQAVTKEMRQMNFITDSDTPTVKNSNLTLLSMNDPEEVEIVVSLVENNNWKNLLSSLYVKRLPVQKIQESLHMDEPTFNKAKQQAETELKKRLLETQEIYFERDNGKVVNLVSLAISSKVNQVTTDELIYEQAANTYMEEEDYPEIRDLLEEFYPRKSFKEQWHHYVQDTFNSMKLSEVKRDIFKKRFVENIPTSTLAATYGKPDSWIKNTFSKTVRELKGEIKRQYLIQTA